MAVGCWGQGGWLGFSGFLVGLLADSDGGRRQVADLPPVYTGSLAAVAPDGMYGK